MIDTIADLRELVRSKGVSAALRACRRPPLSSRLLRDLYQQCGDDAMLMEFLAGYPLIPSDLAGQMAGESSRFAEAVAVALAGNPRTSPVALQRLLQSATLAVRLQLAANPRLSQREFADLATAEDVAVRAALARNPQLPIGWQLRLAADVASEVRSAVASRKGLDFDIAVVLSHDPDPAVRAAVLLKGDTSDEIRQLHADCDHIESQRILLGAQRPLPASVAASLRLSPHGEIRRQACEVVEPDGPELLFFAESEDVADRLWLASRSSLPVAIQRLLLNDPVARVRRRLAANPAIAADIAAFIAAADDVAAASALAANLQIPADVVLALCHHPADTVAEIVTVRDDLTSAHWDALIHRQSTAAAELLALQGVTFPGIRQPTAVQLAASAFPSVRALAAGSRHLPAAVFWQLAVDRAPAVRFAVARNPAAPSHLLYELSGSTDRNLAFAAEDTLRVQQSARLA